MTDTVTPITTVEPINRIELAYLLVNLQRAARQGRRATHWWQRRERTIYAAIVVTCQTLAEQLGLASEIDAVQDWGPAANDLITALARAGAKVREE